MGRGPAGDEDSSARVERELRNIIGMCALMYVAYTIFPTVKSPGRAPPHARPMHARTAARSSAPLPPHPRRLVTPRPAS